MPCIYKITNSVTGKVYIGKTLEDIEHRWKKHVLDSNRDVNAHRPLYRAFRKYGIESFQIEMLEECAHNELSEREKYWIKKYDSYKNGYNATVGGDGRAYIDYERVFDTYIKCGENCAETARTLCIDKGTVVKVVKMFGGTIHHSSHTQKPVQMIDKNGHIVRVFDSTRDAGRYIAQKRGSPEQSAGGYSSHIADVCNGKRKTCDRHIWRYV